MRKSLKVYFQTSIGAATGTSPMCKHACGMIRNMKRNSNLKFLRVFILLPVMFTMLLTGCGNSDQGKPVQFEKQEGQRLVRINIRDFGAVTFRLIPNEQEEIVNGFIDKCKSGFYNGTSFYNIIEDYLMIGGRDQDDPATVSAKASDKLYPFKGSLCLNISGDGKCSLNSFIIITIDKGQLDNIEELVEHKGFTFSDYIKFGYKTELSEEELTAFRTYGGAPWLYGHTVVLGQAIEGMDVLENISKIHTDEPETEIIIDSIETD